MRCLNMNDQQLQLWQKIEEFRIDNGDVDLTFANRLARENGWSAGQLWTGVLKTCGFQHLAGRSQPGGCSCALSIADMFPNW